MLEYQKTSLWLRTLGPRENDQHARQRETLSVNFEAFRGRVKTLIDQISKDLPHLTVHDITHVDALWEIADLIACDADTGEYPLTPAEGFVLGGAFLLHDAGMTLAAYPNGLADLEEQTVYQDALAVAYTDAGMEMPPTRPSQSDVPEAIRHRAIAEALRLLHAENAERLATKEWHWQGKAFFLIEREMLRESYGRLIGLIAASHWWDVRDLERLGRQLVGASSELPIDWTVDALKIACLLRTADAAHIDARRAPLFRMALTQPGGVSQSHWIFQSKLTKPTCINGVLIYASGTAFGASQIDAWWLCFDTIRMIDRELSAVDALLQDLRRPRFRAKRVFGADSPSILAQRVVPQGWKPIPAEVKITDVSQLVERLGGKELYGNDPLVPLRELIQNAADAIRARRLLQNRGADFGRIDMVLRKEGEYNWLDVCDNGIGMSERVLTGELLDFGKSLWRSPRVLEEFRGLRAAGFQATGRYGMGFFSTFMVGDVVNVTTQRYDWGQDDTLVLEFRDGLKLRPILREAQSNERLRDPGTRVSIRLLFDPYSPDSFLAGRRWNITPLLRAAGVTQMADKIAPFWRVAVYIACALDVDVFVTEFGSQTKAVGADDWLDLDAQGVLQRLNPWDACVQDCTFSKLLPINDANNDILGRAFILPTLPPKSHGTRFDLDVGACVEGGLFIEQCYPPGIVKGESKGVARRQSRTLIPQTSWNRWARTQVQFYEREVADGSIQLLAAIQLSNFTSDLGELPVCIYRGEFLSRSRIYHEIYENKCLFAIGVFDADFRSRGCMLPYTSKNITQSFIDLLKGFLDNRVFFVGYVDADHIDAKVEEIIGRTLGDDRVIIRKQQVECLYYEPNGRNYFLCDPCKHLDAQAVLLAHIFLIDRNGR